MFALSRSWRRRVLVVAVVWLALVGPWRRQWIDREAPTAEWAPTFAAPIKSNADLLRAGVARRDITDLGVGVPLAGYAGRVFRANTGVRDPIAIRALVLDNGANRVAFLSAELLLVNRMLANAVLNLLQKSDPRWRRDQLYFGATHTHSAPGGFAGEWVETFGLGRYRAELANRLAERIADVITEAATSAAPADWTLVKGPVDASLIRNRTVPGGPVNRSLETLFVRKKGEKRPLASLVVFSAHATCQPTSDMRISGDYPGALMRRVEADLGGVCLFLAGSVGGMAPAEFSPRETAADKLGAALASYVGERFRDCNDNRFQPDAEIDTLGFEFSLPTPNVKVTANWRVSPVLTTAVLPTKAWVHALRVGDSVWLGTPSDYNGELANTLRENLAGLIGTVVVTSFDGDYVGYVVPSEQYDLDRYEPRSMTFYGPHLGPIFQATLRASAESLAKRRR